MSGDLQVQARFWFAAVTAVVGTVRADDDVIDTTSFETSEKIGIDGFSPGGLAAIPLPEPTGWILQTTGVMILIALGRVRARNRRSNR